jgi:hypothetical protein
MKEYAIQKQFIPNDTNNSDPEWAKRQVWVYKLNSTDEVDDFDTLSDAQGRLMTLSSSDPSQRVYRIVRQISGSDTYLPIE